MTLFPSDGASAHGARPDPAPPQRQAAEAMKTTQPRLNDVLHGRIEKCSIDRLVKMLAEVGRRVRVQVEAA